MTTEKIIEYCATKWPSNISIFIVDQKHSDEWNNRKNVIEILILDPQFSAISTTRDYDGENTLNCILAPLNNIENLLVNEMYSGKGTFLKMLSEGRILDSKNMNLSKAIKEQANLLIDIINHTINEEYKKNISALIGLRNNFEKKLLPYQKFFLINDVVANLSQAELTKNTNWKLGGNNKSYFLKNNCSTFVSEIMHLTTRAFQDLDSDNFLEIETYLNYYLESASPVHLIKKNVYIKYYAIGIRYRNFDLNEFVIKVIAEIQKHEILSLIYKYFFCSPKIHYNIYTAEINLIFGYNKKISRSQVHRLLTQFVENILQRKVTLTFLPTNYLINEATNRGFFNQFIPIGKEIGDLCQKQILKLGKIDEETLFFIGTVLSSYIIKSLDLSIEDTIKTNFYLTLRYMFSPKEQSDAQFMDNINIIRQKKYQIFSQYYQNNLDIINALVKRGISNAGLEANVEYGKIIQEIDIYLKNIISNFESIKSNNQITLIVLKERYQIEEELKALIFTILFEQIMTTLNLGNQQFCLCTFVISESILSLKGKQKTKIVN